MEKETNQNKPDSVKPPKPRFLQDFETRRDIFEIFSKAYDCDCSCEVCQKIREYTQQVEKQAIKART